MIALIVAFMAFLVPQGYIVGLAIGTGLYYSSSRISFFAEPEHPN